MNQPRMVLSRWKQKGFGEEPVYRTAGDDGLIMYRCWGGTSTQEGSGYFSSRRPGSVTEAELMCNVVDWNNKLRKVSTFRLKPGFGYFIGPIAHGRFDMHLKADQIFVPAPHLVKIEQVGPAETLNQDATVFIPDFAKLRPS
jgi:hypothetical protein